MRPLSELVPLPSLLPSATVANPASVGSPAAAMPATSIPLAEITSVPVSQARKVLSPASVRIATLLTLAPIAGIVSGVGLFILGIAYAHVTQVFTIVCVLAGFADIGISVWSLLNLQKLLASRYLKSLAQRSFRERTDALVSCDDPEAQFVDVTPRHLWNTSAFEPQADIGFLKIDRQRQELLLEGDVKRYRIPFAAVTRCEVEEIRLASDQWGTDLYYAVVLDVETTEGARELPLFKRHLELASRRMRERNRHATLLCEQIREALG